MAEMRALLAELRPSTLADVELEVLTLMVEGLNNTQIAGKLTVSPSTIKSPQQHPFQIRCCQPDRSGDAGAA